MRGRRTIDGPALDIDRPALDEFGPELDEFGPELDEFGPELDEFGPELDEFGPELDEFYERGAIGVEVSADPRDSSPRCAAPVGTKGAFSHQRSG